MFAVHVLVLMEWHRNGQWVYDDSGRVPSVLEVAGMGGGALRCELAGIQWRAGLFWSKGLWSAGGQFQCALGFNMLLQSGVDQGSPTFLYILLFLSGWRLGPFRSQGRSTTNNKQPFNESAFCITPGGALNLADSLLLD
jgi:hypothetical protein